MVYIFTVKGIYIIQINKCLNNNNKNNNKNNNLVSSTSRITIWQCHETHAG
jgi:hypothetical protein